jgi:hypothetical protein
VALLSHYVGDDQETRWIARHVRIAGLSLQPQSADNRTARIPEPVIAALLRWSLKYIDHFAADIFAARAEYDALEWDAVHREKRQATPALLDRIDAYIGRRCAEAGFPSRSITAAADRKLRATEPKPTSTFI